MNKNILSFITLLSLFLILNIATHSNAEDLGILRRGVSGDPLTLDPHKILTAFESTIMTDLYVALATTSADDKVIPGSAESWTISEDGLKYVFKMRKNLKWSDGTPLNSYDFLYSLRRQVDPKTASRTVEYFRPILNASEIYKGIEPVEKLGVYAPDSETLIIKLSYPAPYLMEILSIDGRPVPKHIIEKHGDNWIRPENIVVNGAFNLEEWIPGSYIKLKKNKNFYDEKNVKLSNVFHIIVEDLNTGFRRFRAGEIDTIVLFPPEQLSFIKKKMPETLKIIPGLSTEFYIFNVKKKPFDDSRVRLALSMAIDREILVEKVLKTGEVPAYSYIPPTMNGYSSRPSVGFANLSMIQRKEKAIKLLEEAGFNNENPLVVPLRYNTQDLQSRQAAAISAMWKTIGVKTNLINTERKVLASDRANSNFSVARYLRVAGNYDATAFMLPLSKNLSSRNFMQYESEKFNELFLKAWYTNNMTERNKKIYNAEEQALLDHPMIPLYFYSSRRLVKPYVKGWVSNSRGVYPSRWVYIEK